MVLPTKGNLPQQKRTGYNQGPQALTLSQAKFLGQPAVKCARGDTVIFRNSPQVPGESNPRALGMIAEFCGAIFNGTGGNIQYDIILLDDLGNEFTLEAGVTISDTQYINIVIGDAAESGLLCLPVGWSLIVRVTDGNPSNGRGVVAWPWAHDMGRNLIPIMQPVTMAGLEIGPPEGRAWQLTGNIFGAMGGEEAAKYLNFDSVPRVVEQEIIILAGEEFLTNILMGAPQPIGIFNNQSENAWYQLTCFGKAKGMILAYPDKIRMVARENQTTAPLYVNMNFAEFDLPRDMG